MKPVTISRQQKSGPRSRDGALRHWRLCAGLLLACIAGVTVADTPPVDDTPPAVDTPPVPVTPLPGLPSWQPAAPVAGAKTADSEWDWVQLTSGEWIKGELLGLERDVLEFDSDKLDLLELDWEDIRQIHSAQPMAVLFGDSQLAVGYLVTEINAGGQPQLVVLGPDARMTLDDVIGIAKGTPNEMDLWSGDVSISLNLRTGNIEQQDLNSSLSLRRRTAHSSLRLSYLSHYSRYDSEENTNDHRASVNYDYRLNRDWFLRPVTLEYFRDPFQNIDHQASLGSGVGLYVFDTNDLTWIIAAGPGYQITRYHSEVEESKRQAESAILFLTTQYEHELTDDVDLSGLYQVYISDEESGRARHHAQFSVDVDLTDRLDLLVAVYWDRTDRPQPDEYGVSPDKNDAQLAVGLSLEI